MSREYELVARSSIDFEESFNGAHFDHHKPNYLRYLLSAPFVGYRRTRSAVRRRSVCSVVFALAGILVTVIILTFIFLPSYTHLPPHYIALRNAVRQSTAPGRGNPRDEKVFIAVSLYDKKGDLAGGQWGQTVLDLIDMLGPNNVFLSIYENDSGQAGERALDQLAKRVACNKSIVYEEHFNFTNFPTVTLPDGSKRIRRVEYLAEVRNRALRPLDEHHPEIIRYDRLLFLNDVYFDPLDAVHLLFSTNANNADGIATYRAACAVDFINAFKFYDTFASRDLQGYGMGLPFFPWFTTAGQGQSRRDVLEGKDAVRVRSCWGGMVAFDAAFFQRPEPANATSQKYMGRNIPVRFRAEQDLFWESSECCLIHADIQRLPANPDNEKDTDTGTYMNPFIRVAYDRRSFSWLGITRRFERLYPLAHNIANHVAGRPRHNPRRAEIAGEEVQERVWTGSSFATVTRIASSDGFCGQLDLQVLAPREENGDGWESVPVPD
ncbi:hypothetical protein VTN77DRAFT_6527 [Rasamsonia byssochlamydoides]|uniref:uncharacterized protein n=1 Tax=Rasamsonia byssochlamydoides TaxID=89139 RepID=UPI003742C707